MNTRLYSRLSDLNLLFRAWQKVKVKKSAGGIDKISVLEFESELDKNLKTLSQEIKDFTYVSEPHKIFHIKKNKTERRKLALLSVRDKILQHAVKEIIEPKLEEKFPNVSYGYRPGKSTTKAIRRIVHEMHAQKLEYVVTCDIDNFFDEISHEILLQKLNKFYNNDKLVELIKIWLKIGEISNDNKWQERTKGIAQGSVLAPILSNFYMQAFDLKMMKEPMMYVRYSDNFILLGKDKQTIQKSLNKSVNFLNDALQLKLNKGYQIKHEKEGFEFLGVFIQNKQLDISEKKLRDLQTALSNSFSFKNNKLSGKFNETIQGIANYYGKLLQQDKLENLDESLLKAIHYQTVESYNANLKIRKKDIEKELTTLRFFSLKFNEQKNEHVKKILTELVPANRKKTTTEKDKPKTPEQLIRKKKREYRKLESQNHDLIVKTSGVFIGKSNSGIHVKKGKKRLIHMKSQNLENIIISAKGVTLSSDVIRYCAKQQINILFLEFNGKPYALMHAVGYNTGELGMAQLQAEQTEKAAGFIKASLRSKIKNQINLIKYNAKYRLDKDEQFAELYTTNIAKMKALADKIKQIADVDFSANKNKLFTIEAQAAAYYWKLFEKILDEYIIFEGRKHQGADDPVNAMLNYGYGVLYSKIWTALLRAGLNPNISYLHSMKDNAPALVFDFIEQFRQQAVDRQVIAIISRDEEIVMEKGSLTKESRLKVAERVLERLNKYEKWNGKEMMLSDIINMQASELARFLLGKRKKYKAYIAKW